MQEEYGDNSYHEQSSRLALCSCISHLLPDGERQSCCTCAWNSYSAYMRTATGSVVLNSLPATGDWIVIRNPGGQTTSGSGTSTTISGLAPGTYTLPSPTRTVVSPWRHQMW
jgi:hypothetical protein